MTDKDLGDLGVAAGDIISEAFHLGYETGRNYIPPGGMALTAEQVEDVRKLSQMDPWWSAEHVEEVQARVRAMLPSNAHIDDDLCPEVNVMNDQCVFLRGHDGLHRACGYKWSTAPAEPAEEQTKAELCAVRLCVLPARHSGVHADHEGLRWNNPASSPVVPAPTETGPWKTCGHVPIGIVFRSKDRHPSFTWVNEGGSLFSVRNECEDGHFSDGEHCLPSMVDENFAPFVAAEEG